MYSAVPYFSRLNIYFYFIFLQILKYKNSTAFVVVPHWRCYGGLLSRALSSTPFSLLHHYFSFWFDFFRLDFFDLPLAAALVVLKLLLDGPNPQDVSTSRGVDLISNMHLKLDAGTYFNCWR